VRRLPSEKFADFAARQLASQLAARKPKFRAGSQDPNRPVRRRKHVETYEDRLDDLGESPDF
jgi:hypothetical protein